MSNRTKFILILFLMFVFGAGNIQAQSIPPTNINIVLQTNAHVLFEWFQQSEATQIYLYKTRLGDPQTFEFLGAYNVSPGYNSWHSGDDALTRHLPGDKYYFDEWVIGEDGQSNRKLGTYGPFDAYMLVRFPFIAKDF